jgi:hypothetical protein
MTPSAPDFVCHSEAFFAGREAAHHLQEFMKMAAPQQF